MPREAYIERRFSDQVQRLIDGANTIITEYQAQGYVLTLRQLYYQFVARGWLPNKQSEYKRLGSAVNDGRMAGLIDWEAIEDRTRALETTPSWDHPRDILDACSEQFRFDKWTTQPYRVEVWVEKEALAGVIERACGKYFLPWFACRGYTSASEQWRASKRFATYILRDQKVLILHLGDHDPSGIDMTRDNQDRLDTFLARFGDKVQVKRIALNENQVRQYNPPPNPVKLTDSRSPSYREKFGDESWELDALDPRVLSDLIHVNVERVLDKNAWAREVRRETRAREQIADLAARWED